MKLFVSASLLALCMMAGALNGCAKKDSHADTAHEEKGHETEAGHGEKSHGDTHAKAGHWGYSGEEGPENWGSLDKKNKACATGKRQSPIDLQTVSSGKFVKITLDYQASPATVQNNGHTIQFALTNAGGVVVDGVRYHLKQFHFHTPSEHALNGKRTVIENHFVHQSDKGDYLVLGVMSDIGVADPILASLWTYIPTDAGKPLPISDLLINPKDLMPNTNEFHVYAGSLTTPPCTEGVTWMVYNAQLTVSAEQADALAQIVGPNSRPLQPRQERDLMKIIGRS